MNTRNTTTIVALTALALLAGTASATITGTTGGVTQISPPLACGPGQLTSLFQAWCWDEQQGVTTSGVICDETQNPGGSAAPVLGSIAGTFDSHFVHFEPTPGIVATTGTISFASAIKGVIYRAQFLDFTDANFGAPATTYPTGYPLRGLSNFPSSNFTVLGNTFSFTFFYPVGSNEVFQVRILTDHVAPAPSAATALVGMGGFLAARRRRR